MSNESVPIAQDAINKALWDACDTFRGGVAASVYQDYVLTMLFLKYLSDVWQDHYDQYQKEYGDEPELIVEMLKNERFVLPEGASFYDLNEQRSQAGNGERIDVALHAIEEANGTKLRDGDHGVFQDISFNSTRLGDEATKNDALCSLLKDFNKPELNLRPSRVGTLDVIGNAYEYLIEKFAAGAGKKAGEFYTPAAVSELMARLVQPEEGDQICDPACGSASLLMKCGRQIREHHKGSGKYALFGQEAIGSTWALAKMNMFLHGEDNHIIKWGDTLRNPLLLDKNEHLRQFDIVVANPPFSLDKWGHDVADKDPHHRYQRGIPPRTKGDYAFILHMIETLKPDTGRMAVVVPHGVLFRGASEGRIRKALIDENLLDGVIGLPQMLFFGTGIPAAILIFRKDKSDKNVMFIDASREYRDGKKQNSLTEEHVQKTVSTYLAGENVDKYAYVASPEDIAENDYNLNIPRYVDTFEEEEEIDLMAVREERLKLKQELEVLEVKMEGYLKELGRVSFETQRNRRLEEALPDEFSELLLEGAVRVVMDFDNPVRAHLFAAAFRELCSHILQVLAPDEQVRACSWFEQAKDTNTVTRRQRATYACQGGLSVHYVENLGIDVSDMHAELVKSIDVLSRATHVKEKTLMTSEVDIRTFSENATLALEGFLGSVNASRRVVTECLENDVYSQLIQIFVEHTFSEIDLVCSHGYEIDPFIHVDEIAVVSITAEQLGIKVSGEVPVKLRYGKGSDSTEIAHSFPFVIMCSSPVDAPHELAFVDAEIDDRAWYGIDVD